jgi:uncharacterized protein
VLSFEQRALRFSCHGSSLYGVLNRPVQGDSRGVLIVVGGPQYRAGSHRQFSLLARDLAAFGMPAMCFDYRGMGDSEGDPRTFEDVDEDIRHAIDHFFAEIPLMKEVVIWGLCDAASAALFYAHRDPRVGGLVLLNPWVRTTDGMAKTYLKHYYLKRLSEPELWRKIFRGSFDYRTAVRSILSMAHKALRHRGADDGSREEEKTPKTGHHASLPDRMLDGLSRFEGKVLLILSGNDLTAREFLDVVNGSRKWRNLLAAPRVQRHDLPDATHTFSRHDWRDQVASWTREWVRSW